MRLRRSVAYTHGHEDVYKRQDMTCPGCHSNWFAKLAVKRQGTYLCGESLPLCYVFRELGGWALVSLL